MNSRETGFFLLFGGVAAIMLPLSALQSGPISDPHKFEYVEEMVAYAKANPNGETAQALVDAYQDELITKSEYTTLRHVYQREQSSAELADQMSDLKALTSSGEVANDN